MKRFLTIILLVFASIIVFGQNYKEGDFSGKQVKGKSLKLDNNWVIDKNSSGTISWKYNGTSKATLTSDGTFTPTTQAATTGTFTNATVTTTFTTPGGETITKTTGNGNSITASGSLKVTDTIRIGSTQYLLQTTVNRIKFEGSISTGTSDSVETGVLTAATGNITDAVIPAAGSLVSSGKAYFDSTLYFGDDNTNTWITWASQQMGTGGVKSRINIENMGNYSIQNKAGTGQVLVIQRDTTGSTAVANLTNLGAVTAVTVGISGTDTVTSAPVGSVCYRAADSTLWLKIKSTGTNAERWNKITVGK